MGGVSRLKRVRRGGAALAVLALVVAAPEAVRAQACIGQPQGAAGALQAAFRFPDGGTGYALQGMAASSAGDIFFQGGFGITAPDREELSNIKAGRGLLAYEIGALSPQVSVCPAAGAEFRWIDDENLWSIPFGIAFGGTLPFGSAAKSGLTPWVFPHFLYERFSIDDVDDSDSSDVYVAATGGLTIHLDAFTITGSFEKVFEEDVEAVFGVAVGVAWR